MKVNVIVPWDQARVGGRRRRAYHRLARYLRRIEGWDITGGLDAAADVNYVFVYADNWKREADPWQKYRDWEGPLACYFTHYNPMGMKRRLWREAAETVDLRIAESQKYARLLEPHGPTEHMIIPIERDSFRLGPKVAHARPLIGVAGLCCRTGHKGDVLVYELKRYFLAQNWSIIGAGKGWPVPTKIYHWRNLPAFYQSLSVFLCTSFYEGGPLTVFEALSCGTPVVIPRDVGALDELPDMYGIYRYTAGDFDEMYRALRECIKDKGAHDRRVLRALTKGMTVDAYCRQHEEIFEKHFGGRTSCKS